MRSSPGQPAAALLSPPVRFTTTGWKGLDEVLGGLAPGDNVVWSVENIDDYRGVVVPYDRAAADAGLQRIYFRFGNHPPLLDESPGLTIRPIDPSGGFEPFVRSIHRIIEAAGPGAAYIFDSLSDLAGAWTSDLALGNFFVLTCPRLFQLHTFTYFGILRDAHSASAAEPIRETTQFLLDVFSLDGRLYIRPLKVQDRSGGRMNTLHVQVGERLLPVEESVILARILGRTRGPRLNQDPDPGFWNRLTREVERALALKREGALAESEERALLVKVRAHFRVHRSGISALAEEFLTLEDFYEIRKRQIGVGSIGGKALGMLVARAILRREAPDIVERLETHDSFFVGAEVFVSYLVRNGIWWIRERQREPGRLFEGIEEGKKRTLEGEFSASTVRQFEDMLDYFGEAPCIVRSSSILEDARGNAFSGKYESFFLSNVGSREERLNALLDAIRKVYASIFNRETLLYRKARNLLESEERMALLIMRVSGSRRGRYFFPQAAGVGLSYNPYRWHPEIDPAAGVIRLVFGLGTRAVDRSDDDYTRLVALNSPHRRTETSFDEQLDHCQRRIDVLDLEGRSLVAVPIENLISECNDFPLDLYVQRLAGDMPWVTFRDLLGHLPVIDDFRRILAVLENAYHHPVDIEFALNFLPDGTYRIHLLQCRTFQIQKNEIRGEIDPKTVPGRRILAARGAVIGIGREIPIHDLLYVSAGDYSALRERDRYLVGKIIEKLAQQHSPERNLLLVGPGRWGTSSPSLGIPVRAGRIALACAVCEVVAMHSGLVPDVSLGTHFFNDLVEHDLLYFACFAGKGGNSLDEEWLLSRPSRTEQLLGKPHQLARIVRWIDASSEGLTLHADPFYQTAALRLPE
ncbi:MAG: PEP/pyruvate-binding domain-containing protein [Verrucomicrobiae bacterium]